MVGDGDGGGGGSGATVSGAAVMVMMMENRRGLSLVLVVLFVLLCAAGVPSMLVAPAVAPTAAAPVTALEAADLRDEVGCGVWMGIKVAS